jgi:hypothetical protein
MLESKDNINLLGSIIANLNNVFLIGIFLARIYKYQTIEYWLGLLFISSFIPLMLMLAKAFEMNRPLIYLIQLILMLSFICLELLLDYILKIDFRQNRNILIPYITLFYASFGGMIGIASQAGKPWSIITIITFFVMTFLSLFMHFKAGT